jgi:hypothetical protein
MKNLKILVFTLFFLTIIFFPIIYIFFVYENKNSYLIDNEIKKNLFKYFSIKTHELINSEFYKNDTEFLLDYIFNDIYYSNGK